MKKRKITMALWTLCGPPQYALSGFGLDHPLGRWYDLSFVYGLQEAQIEEDALHYMTEEYDYVCPLKYAKIPKYKTSWDPEEKSGFPDIDRINEAVARIANGTETGDLFTEHLKKLTDAGRQELNKMLDAEHKRLISEAEKYPDCLYIELSNIFQGDIAAYHIGGKSGILPSFLHTSITQDSVVYLPSELGEPKEPEIDFRYYPLPSGEIETYACFGIKRLVLKNALVEPRVLRVDSTEIAPGETKVLKF